MNAGLKKLAVTVIAITMFLSYILVNLNVAYSSGSNGNVDLYTQKKPYSGKGPNKPSDAFGPGETVTLYASVTYNDCPVGHLLVAFEVRGPRNPVENITFCRTAFTNETGIATISFRVSHLNETTFGEWTAVGNARIGDLTFQDSISFKVSWIVEIVSIDTMNENHVPQEKFTRDSYVGIKLALRNIAMTEKEVTIAITIYDCLDVLLNSTEIHNFKLQPNGTLVYVYCFLYIPKSAYVGEATASACTYTTSISLGGIPYSPEISKHFFITNRDIKIVSLQIFPLIVFRGEIVKIDVIVENEGWEIESFNVSIYYNETLIDVLPIFDLQPRWNTTASLFWNTSYVEEGVYQISAYVEPVLGEIDISDNKLINGFVEIKTPIHDIAVLNVIPSSNIVYLGETLNIKVTVANEGTYIESFNVVLYYDDYQNVIETLQVPSLKPGETRELIFNWSVKDVLSGNYTLKAFAEPINGEEDVADNYFVDGVVEVRTAPSAWFVPDWSWYLLLLLLILLLLLLLLWFYKRRKRKKAEETFYSGWTAWYYCYNRQNKPLKS